MDDSFRLTLQIVIAVCAGISAQVLGESLKLPGIVFLLLFGILLGSDVSGVLHPSELGVGLEAIVALSVAVILFEGGLNLELRDLGRVSSSLQRLVTLGTLIVLLGGGMAAHWLGEFPWPLAFLYASLVVVTGPTVVGPLLKQVNVDRQVATLLEGEGVLIDPVGAILAVVVLDTILNSNAGAIAEVLQGLLLRSAVGAAIGVGGGALLGLLLKRVISFLSEDLKNLVVLAGVWGIFGLSQTIRSESGLMAMVVAGIVLRALSIPQERLLLRFKGQLTTLFVSVLFILLAADLSIQSIIALGWGGVLTVLCLMFVVRPLSIALCTWQSEFNWRQKLFIAWIAPRGIVSASVASLFAILLTQRGMNGGDALKAIVFLTIMMTVFLQGLTAALVARWLRITSAEATGAVIVGCNPLGRTIGRLFAEQGESVVLIDTDPEDCEQARAADLEVFQSSALDPEALEGAGIESTGTFLAITSNEEVNFVVAQRAVEEFQPPRTYAVFASVSGNQNKVTAALAEDVSVKTWNKYLDEGQIKLGKTVFPKKNFALQTAHLQALIRGGEVLPLLVRRNGHLQVARALEEWQPGDEVLYLLHDSRPKLLKRLSGGNQSSRLALEKLPEVEEVPLPTAPAES
ncbi:MAG: cation:proton antiporter [Cyanobacteria bacterium J06641_5]